VPDGNAISRESDGERSGELAAGLARRFADLARDAVAPRSVMFADAWLGLEAIAMAPDPEGLEHA
jgi:hypothetical protein